MNRNLIYIVCCILFITTGSFSQEKAVSASSTMKLIYVYDALCGWCYGFSPVITDFSARHASEFAVEVVSGGMVLGAIWNCFFSAYFKRRFSDLYFRACGSGNGCFQNPPAAAEFGICSAFAKSDLQRRHSPSAVGGLRRHGRRVWFRCPCVCATVKKFRNKAGRSSRFFAIQPIGGTGLSDRILRARWTVVPIE